MTNFNADEFENDQQAIAGGLFDVAYQIRSLGNGGAATPMGAIEAFSKFLCESIDQHSCAIDGVHNAINRVADGLEHIAQAIRETGGLIDD